MYSVDKFKGHISQNLAQHMKHIMYTTMYTTNYYTTLCHHIQLQRERMCTEICTHNQYKGTAYCDAEHYDDYNNDNDDVPTVVMRSTTSTIMMTTMTTYNTCAH